MKYLLSYVSKNGAPVAKATATYNEGCQLVSVEVRPDMKLTEVQIAYIWNAIPLTEHGVRELKHDQIKVQEVGVDLTFESFWNKYGYKVGKKERAKKLWDVMPDTERAEVFASIPKYNKWLSTKNTERLYPETFLAQRRWESEYR